MTSDFTLIVTDTSPLITLAKADALNTLLFPRWPIRIPDAVFGEATLPNYPDAERILMWVQANDLVTVEPTELGLQRDFLLASGRAARNLGELAALDVLDRYLLRSPATRAVLIYEDSDLQKRRAVLEDRIALVTTGSWLAVLEHSGLIQSADQILDDAKTAGRNVDKQRGAPVDADLAAAFARFRRDR